MHIADPAAELNDFYGYARKLRTMAAQHVDARERNRLELMACRIESDASTFAQQFAARSTPSANV